MDALLSDASVLLSSTHTSPSPPPVRRSHAPPSASFSCPSASYASSSSQAQAPASPLTLPPSRSLIPSSLKFLWFRNSDPLRPGSEPLELVADAAAADPLDEISDPAWTCTCREDLRSPPQSADGHQDRNDESGVTVVPALPVGESFSVVDSFEPSVAATNQQQEAARDGKAKGWISRFLDPISFWKDLRSLQSAAVTRLVGAKSGNADSDIVKKANHLASACDLAGCLLEGAYQRVVHDKESVSAFLLEVPVIETKTIVHLCSLSNLAYMIPRIEARELFKRHRLTFITSSLEKKVEAEAQAKDRSNVETPGIKCKDFKVFGNSVAADVRETMNSDLAGASKAAALSLAVKAKQMESTTQPAVETVLQEDGNVLKKRCTRELFQGEAINCSRGFTTAQDVQVKKSSCHKESSSAANCPCEWFICDDQSSHIRYLTIQGSESLASWKTNLAFDPTRFEELGVLVHRGVYEAAKGLYEMVLPEIVDHIRAHGELAQLRFTGHSLGGSLATLLALMLLIRGVIKPNTLLPIVTFGAPYVLCGGDHLLQKLNLKRNQFLSVVMHRDIVPRAFTCDYPDHIAQILKRLNGTFREHPCLKHQKLLYAPMGQMVILQPDPTHSPGHPLLPSGVGLYFIRHPSNEQDKTNTIQLVAAQRAFMNMPHPLEMLRHPGAYGFEGAISRDHDPRSYAKALKVVTRLALKKLRRKHRDLRRHLWWPLVTAEASLLAQKAGATVDMNPIGSGAASPALSRNPKGRREMVTSAIAEHCEFPRSSTRLPRYRAASLNKYARLIASRHVHVGLLLILSARMISLDIFSSFIAWG